LCLLWVLWFNDICEEGEGEEEEEGKLGSTGQSVGKVFDSVLSVD